MPVERHEFETCGDSMSQGTSAVIEALRKIIPSVQVACEYGLDRVSVAVHLSPSVCLARWEDGHPDRYTSTDKLGGFWWAIAWDEDSHFTRGTGGTREEARAALSAALDKAGATTEGERDA